MRAASVLPPQPVVSRTPVSMKKKRSENELSMMACSIIGADDASAVFAPER